MSSLPEDIIEENILTRLPVKSISRFRCVSKNWCILFRNPNFIRKHLNHANLTNNFKILVTNEREIDDIATESVSILQILMEPYLFCIDNDVLLSSSSRHALKIDYPYMCRESVPKILGSCNGLVCINPRTNYRGICLWNPATREYKRVPGPPAESDSEFMAGHGFGFDCENDDYKVLDIMGFKEGGDVSIARVYSLATNSWKELGTIPYDFYYGHKGFLLNGVLHWMATRLGSNVIVCYDISNEAFSELPFPKTSNEGGYRFMSGLGVWEAKLCVICTNHMEDHDICTHQNDRIDVWTMVGNKWSKLLKITAQIADMSYRRPIQTLQNGEILLEGGPSGEGGFGLTSYDPNLKRARALQIMVSQPCLMWRLTLRP